MFGFTMSDAWRKLVQCALNATAGAACVLFTPRANAELVSFEAAVQARVHKLACINCGAGTRGVHSTFDRVITQHKASTPV